MATGNKLKNTKRQPAKRQLPSSSIRRTPKTAKKVTTASKGKVAKPPLKQKAQLKKPGVQRRVAKPKTSSLCLRLGRRTLVVSFKLSTKMAPARKKRASSRKKRSSQASWLNRVLARKQQVGQAVLLISLGIAGSTYFGLQVFAAPALEPTNSSQVIEVPAPVVDVPAAEVKKPKTLPSSLATRLQIPDIALDTEVNTIGRNADDTIEVPHDHRVAGLYRFGPTPGELGPAIIVGHVSSLKGPGVFWKLRELRPGQIINVSRADGSVAVFKITQVKNFAQNAFPTAEVYGNIDHSGLRLITCGGIFNIFTQRYDENSVVFASLAEEATTGFAADSIDIQTAQSYTNDQKPSLLPVIDIAQGSNKAAEATTDKTVKLAPISGLLSADFVLLIDSYSQPSQRLSF